MKCFLLLLLIYSAAISNAQQPAVIKAGTTLLYRMDVSDRHFDVEVVVKSVSPFAYQWRIIDSANATGSIQHTEQGSRSANFLNAAFVPGDLSMNDNTSSLILSTNTYRSAGKRNRKPFKLQLKQGVETLVRTVESSKVQVKLNGQVTDLKTLRIKPVVKLAGKYISTGEELISVYDSRELPIIIQLRNGYYLELLEIKQP
ncbi:hypothetical protein EXU57_22710 [Segetibacter sp. 3557_3]|uniref:hypothetical protein n=1 Tax=Segetibacter sp. 3557_3 TaxID=2547429 RepID=UPI00105907EF|nr:hypothetical protein [Segetibacter sp. 3557_3]TDH19719.1 hypothetical protein EXU57_22710 [Segetibacter sp. 3557_3]